MIVGGLGRVEPAKRYCAGITGAVFEREDEDAWVLMETGADPRAGEPNAMASARMLGCADLPGAVLGAREGEESSAVPSAQS